MDIIPLLLISIGLSLEIFAASTAISISMKEMTRSYAIRLAGCFSAFHMLMLLLGFVLGLGLLELIQNVDHWIAFLLLTIIGARMILASIRNGHPEVRNADLSRGGLLVLSLATSIDALALGVSFAALHEAIVWPVVVIGIVVFAFGILGIQIGAKVGKRTGRYAEGIGGFVLILLGFKILLEHMLT